MDGERNTWTSANSFKASPIVGASIIPAGLFNGASLAQSRKQHRHVVSELYAPERSENIFLVRRSEILESDDLLLLILKKSRFTKLSVGTFRCLLVILQSKQITYFDTICHLGIVLVDGSARNLTTVITHKFQNEKFLSTPNVWREKLPVGRFSFPCVPRERNSPVFHACCVGIPNAFP